MLMYLFVFFVWNKDFGEFLSVKYTIFSIIVSLLIKKALIFDYLLVLQNFTSHVNWTTHGFKISSHFQETQSTVWGADTRTDVTGLYCMYRERFSCELTESPRPSTALLDTKLYEHVNRQLPKKPVCRLLTVCRPTVFRNTTIRFWRNSWPTHGHQSMMCHGTNIHVIGGGGVGLMTYWKITVTLLFLCCCVTNKGMV